MGTECHAVTILLSEIKFT